MSEKAGNRISTDLESSLNRSPTGNGNNPQVRIAQSSVNRIRASGPILILAILFLVGSFLTWYFTWFGRELSASEISTYLADEPHPRHVQHALLQIQQRLERGDPGAKQWYPQILALSQNPETEFRLTVAWLMGLDNRSAEFHQALLRLVKDSEPIVRRNAALALVRFNDSSGHGELVQILQPYGVQAVTDGVVASTLRAGARIARGSLVARIKQPDGKVWDVRSPLSGSVESLQAQNGSRISKGETILNVKADEKSQWEALRGLALIGEQEDLPVIDPYARGVEPVSERLKQQAVRTVASIQSRKV